MDTQESKEQKAPEKAPQKHAIFERIKAFFPDEELQDDNSFFDKGMNKFDELEAYKKENEEANQKIVDAIESEPTLASILKDIMQGATFNQALSRHVDPDGLKAEEGDPDYEVWEKNRQERIKNKAANEQFAEEMRANIATSQDDIRSFAEENGLSDDEAVDFIEEVNGVLTDAYKGKITKDFLARMFTARNHEKEVKKAVDNAFIEGKNEKIEETIAAQEEETKGALPSISNSGTKPTESTISLTPEQKTATKFLKGL